MPSDCFLCTYAIWPDCVLDVFVLANFPYRQSNLLMSLVVSPKAAEATNICKSYELREAWHSNVKTLCRSILFNSFWRVGIHLFSSVVHFDDSHLRACPIQTLVDVSSDPLFRCLWIHWLNWYCIWFLRCQDRRQLMSQWNVYVYVYTYIYDVES